MIMNNRSERKLWQKMCCSRGYLQRVLGPGSSGGDETTTNDDLRRTGSRGDAKSDYTAIFGDLGTGVRLVRSSNGGTAFGTPWALNAQGTGGGPKIKWPRKAL
jgi:hypothetical protein